MNPTVTPAPGSSVIVTGAVAPVRQEPSHGSQLVSQLVLGETIVVDGLEGVWLKGRGPDGYAGWTPVGPFRHGVFTAEEWSSSATLRSLGTTVYGSAGLERLPWGARLLPGAVGDTVVVPDGRTLTPADMSRVRDFDVESARGPDALPRSPATVVQGLLAIAEDWIGVPYLWGGRTELGVDCSGFVQALYAAVGVSLPRDSHQQFEADPDLLSQDVDTEPGDLLFFATDGHTITHVGLSLGGSRLLHSASSNGRVAQDDLRSGDPLAALLARSIVGHTRPAER